MADDPSGDPTETPAPPTLFPLPSPTPPAARPTSAEPQRGARLREAERGQIAWGRIDLEATLPAEHPARAIWAVVERLDLAALYGQIAARDEVAGAPAIDPKLLLALWVYATSEGEGSARELGRLTRCHDAYRWLCGGVEVGYHTLSDFRSQQGGVLDALITQVLALLLQQDLVDLHRVAQDGTRVRARAGASSFRRTQTLAARAGRGRTRDRDMGLRPGAQRAPGGSAPAERGRPPGPPGGGLAAGARGDRDQRRSGAKGATIRVCKPEAG
jgi:transposase